MRRYVLVLSVVLYLLGLILSASPVIADNLSVSAVVPASPFSYKEQVRTRLDKPGQYVIADSANPQERLVITGK